MSGAGFVWTRAVPDFLSQRSVIRIPTQTCNLAIWLQSIRFCEAMCLETNSFACKKGMASLMRPMFFWRTKLNHRVQTARTWVSAHLVLNKASCRQLLFSSGPVVHEDLNTSSSWVLMELETQCTLQSPRAGPAARQPGSPGWHQQWGGLCSPLFPSSIKTTYSCVQSAIDLKVMKFNLKLLMETEVCYWLEKLAQPVSLGWIDA